MYKIKDGFIIRKIGNQIMAVPTGSRTSNMHGMIALTESGALLWEALEKGAEIKDLVNILTENYEVDEDVASADTQAFIEGLRNQGALDV